MAVVYRALYRSSNRRRDTIGTLAALYIDIIALFPPWHCYGGAPRGAVPVARDGSRLASAVSRLASATGLPSAPFGAPPTPRSGVGNKKKENPAQKRATGMKKTALFDIVKMRRRERRIGKVALDRIAAAATHSVSAEGALRRAFSPAIVHARA
jgi:hypothetical protein